MLTSLPLEIFIFFGWWWDAFYYCANILVFVYKGKEAGAVGAERRRSYGVQANTDSCVIVPF